MHEQPTTEFPRTEPPDEPGSMSGEPTPSGASGTGQAPPLRRGGPAQRRAASGSTGTRSTGGTTSPPRSAGDSRPTGGPARDLKGKLTELFAGMALIPMAAGDHYSAHIISTRAPHLAEAWADLARQNPAVKRILEGLVQGGAWGGVALATGSVLVPILGHYGMLPPIDPWVGQYGPPPVTQGERRRPIVPPPPGRPGPQVPPNPRANGAGSPATNDSGLRSMTPPISVGQPPGVVTVAGSSDRSTNVEAA